MEDLDALLADLQNTTSHLNNSMKDNNGYGSVNTSTKTYTSGQYSPTQVTSVKIEPRFEYSSQEPESPLYQNQRVVREVTITTTSSHPQPPQNMSAGTLNNNLSELDTLLEDLNSARYADYADKKEPMSPSMNGPSSPLVQIPHHKTVSPSSSISSGGIQEVRPTVESLLDELQSAVPPSSSPPAYSPLARPPENMRVTTILYKTTSPQPVTSTPAPTASSATKELDDLMASLSDFKVNASQLQSQSPPPPPDSPYAKPNKPRSPAPSGGSKPNQLDSMLGTLQSDMSRQGVNTTQKGCCAACGKPIVGQVVTALAKTWHPEHFTCAHCNQELGTKNFFERDGRPYCEADYQNLFSPRCAYCNQAILDKCVTALEKTWHPEHFFCAQCGNAFGEDGFHEKDGKPYCRDDYFDMFAPKCGGCARPIMENYISALNSQWHPDCFVCRDCRQPFNGGSFFDHDGYPYCETHYHAKRGSLCAGCHKPITGRCITAMFRKFHPEHFVCSFCLKQLNKGTFKEQNDKPYCHPCFEKLFG